MPTGNQTPTALIVMSCAVIVPAPWVSFATRPWNCIAIAVVLAADSSMVISVGLGSTTEARAWP